MTFVVMIIKDNENNFGSLTSCSTALSIGSEWPPRLVSFTSPDISSLNFFINNSKTHICYNITQLPVLLVDQFVPNKQN